MTVNRKSQFVVELTPEERQALDNIANYARLPKSVVIRNLVRDCDARLSVHLAKRRETVLPAEHPTGAQ